MLEFLHSRLMWKVFLSYALVLLVGLVVLATATSLSFPAAFDHHLAGNALQYTPQGGKVTIRAFREKSEIVISVSDTGIGISPEQIPLVFDRFYRTDKSRARSSGGSGIGLTIAQALVRAHHSRIWAESGGEGKGSTFSFALPIPIA